MNGVLNWNRCSHIHWPICLLHWNMDQKTEIRSYIKCRIRLNIDSKQIFNELCGIYGPQTISMRTAFRWVKALKAGKFSVEDDTRPGRPKTSVTKANIAALKIVVEQDARLSIKDIASCTGISEGSVQTILNKSCRRTASSPAGYILYCNIFIIKPYNIGHTDLDVFVCKSFCHLDIIIQVWQFSMK